MDLKTSNLSNQGLAALVSYSALGAHRAGRIGRRIVENLDSTGMTSKREKFLHGGRRPIRAFAAAGMDVQLHTHRHRRRYDDEEPSSVTSPTIDSASALAPGHSIISVPVRPYTRASFPGSSRRSQKVLRPAITFQLCHTPAMSGRFLDARRLTDRFEAEMSECLRCYADSGSVTGYFNLFVFIPLICTTDTRIFVETDYAT